MVVNVLVQDLPCSVKGFTIRNEDGSYTIMINSIHTAETMESALQHEIEHIKKGHLDEDKDINEAEEEARR